MFFQATGNANASNSLSLAIEPDGYIRRSGFYIESPNSSMINHYQRLVSKPHGCTEQLTSTLYITAITLQSLRKEPLDAKVFHAIQTSTSNLTEGYEKLVKMECREGGFDWWSTNGSGHLGLTAYVVLTLNEMLKVPSSGVDRSLIRATVDWMMSQRDTTGRFTFPSGIVFGRSSRDLVEAYTLWVLTTCGKTYEDLKPELDFLFRLARKKGLKTRSCHL